MSFSITPSDNIRKHPANNSTSKEIHMFSKTSRFLSPNPEYPFCYLDVLKLSTPSTASFPTEKPPLAMAKSLTSPRT